MTEILLFAVIVLLVGVLVYRERGHEKHVMSLEEKITQVVPQVSNVKEKVVKRPTPNEMVREDSEEVPIAEIPMMDFTDRDFKIQMEGDSETPAEARARKEH